MELTFYPGEWPEAEVVAALSEYAAMAERVVELARVGRMSCSPTRTRIVPGEPWRQRCE